MAITTRREALKLGAAMGLGAVLAGPAFAQQKFFRIGTGGTGGTYYPVGGMIAQRDLDRQDQRQRRRHQRLGRQRQRHRRRLDGVRASARPTSTAWAYTGTGIYEGKPKIEELRVIANLYPGERACRRQEGAGHQVARRPQGQARLARRAGLRHARQRARAARRLRRHREGHQARVSEAGAVRREAQGRLARRLLPDHRLSAGHAVRACRHQRLRAAADRRREARQDHGAVQVLRQGRDPRRRLQGRQGRRDASRSAPSGRRRPSSPTISSTRSPRRCGATRRAPRSTPATPRARRSARRPRCWASAFRCMPAPRNSTRRPAC